jgi:hypothetical protein
MPTFFTKTALPSLGLLCFFCVLLVLLTGCQPPRPVSEGRLGLPADGYVRVITGKTIQTAETQTGHWSVIGERNWSSVALEGEKGEKIVLSGVSPLNNAAKTPNANIWEIDLQASKTGAILSVRGTNGSQKTSTFPITTMEDVSIQTQADQELSLPASLPLVKIGDKTILLEIAK